MGQREEEMQEKPERLNDTFTVSESHHQPVSFFSWERKKQQLHTPLSAWMFNILWLISSCPHQQQTDVAVEFRGEIPRCRRTPLSSSTGLSERTNQRLPQQTLTSLFSLFFFEQ